MPMTCPPQRVEQHLERAAGGLVPPKSPLCCPSDGNTWLDAPQVLDGPRFQWRGALLDVGRHFFSVEFVKKFIDSLAMHKINVFHWHLTEDQVRHHPRAPLPTLSPPPVPTPAPA